MWRARAVAPRHPIVGGRVSAGERTRDFGLDIGAPAEIRAFVRDELQRWGLDGLAEIGQLLVSEVVTNSIRHAGVGGRVSIDRREGAVRVSVTDGGSGRPEPRQAEPTDLTGRGLAIVEALATRWGVTEQRTGKTVWFELDEQETT